MEFFWALELLPHCGDWNQWPLMHLLVHKHFRITSPLRGLKRCCANCTLNRMPLELLPHCGDWNSSLEIHDISARALELLPHCGDWNIYFFAGSIFRSGFRITSPLRGLKLHPEFHPPTIINFRITSPLRGLKREPKLYNFSEHTLELLPHCGDWNPI